MEKLKEFGSRMLKDSALELLKACREVTTFCIRFIEDLNERENLLGMDETLPNKIHEIDRTLKPFEEVWSLVLKYTTCSQSWTRDSIFRLSSDDIELQVKQMLKQSVQLSNNQIMGKMAPLTIKMVQELSEEIKDFQKNIPIIAVFSNPGLKQRHFVEISELIGYEGETLTRKSNLYLNKLMSMGVGHHIDKLEAISETASKEYMIETTLKKMHLEWEDSKL